MGRALFPVKSNFLSKIRFNGGISDCQLCVTPKPDHSYDYIHPLKGTLNKRVVLGFCVSWPHLVSHHQVIFYLSALGCSSTVM